MPASREDLPHRGGGDAMAQPDQFTLHAPVSPGGVLSCHANHQVSIGVAVGGRPGWRRAV
jgi:hypothetical protein